MKIEKFFSELHVESISIGNFKAFGEQQKFTQKPIALLVGPNSSGKSSLIHALVLLNEMFSDLEM